MTVHPPSYTLCAGRLCPASPSVVAKTEFTTAHIRPGAKCGAMLKMYDADGSTTPQDDEVGAVRILSKIQSFPTYMKTPLPVLTFVKDVAMAGTTSILAGVKELSHDAADAICSKILGTPLARTIVLDLREAEDATTAAFARLVLLRRDLLKRGRDLRLSGLRHRAAGVWRISRLGSVLPVQ